MTWMRGRFFIFVAIAVFALMMFFFLVGIFSKSGDAIQFGIYAATLFAVLIVTYCILYAKFQKAVIGNFDTYAVDGKIEFTLEKTEENTLEFTRLTDEESFCIDKADIKTIRSMKTIYVILLKDGRTVDFPKQPDIDDLMRNF